MQPLQFGIDLGGTKTELIVLDQAGQTRFRQRVATSAKNYRAILEGIVGLVRRAESDLGETAHALGVGAPGTPFGPEGRLKNANTTCLIGQPLATDLRARLGIPVFVENDANCLVLSEATDGAGAGANIVFGVILGTGVGAGLVINRQLVNGPNRITGEWGHNPLPHWSNQPHQPPQNPNPHANPRPCYCGLYDCIETYLCGRGLSQTHRELAPGQATELSGSAIAQAAIEGNAVAQAALNQYYDTLARSLATVINVVDPDVVVFGGGLSQLPDLCGAVGARLSQYVFGSAGAGEGTSKRQTKVQTRLAIAAHGDSSGVRGAAWLTQACA